MLDLNLARAANRSFYAKLGRELGDGGSGSILANVLSTYCMRPGRKAEARMVLPSQGSHSPGRERTVRKAAQDREGRQEECSREGGASARLAGEVSSPVSSWNAEPPWGS